jgi:cysteine desulfurase
MFCCIIFHNNAIGGQERGLRSGTLAPALCVGFGAAARICSEDMAYDSEWVNYLSNKFVRY